MVVQLQLDAQFAAHPEGATASGAQAVMLGALIGAHL